MLLESDAKEFVDNINVDSMDGNGSLLRLQILSLLECEWEVRVMHVPTVLNRAADRLAKEGLNSSAMLDMVPHFVREIVDAEHLGSQSHPI